ncbi:hypothetical protein ACWC9T_37180 [Kitasatospora sp. NPDC001159]
MDRMIALAQFGQQDYERIGTLFADYTPDETAVTADWFTRARVVLAESLDEIRAETP